MITLKAYAKINLGLRILRKREDGYHDLETVFARVNPFDEINLELDSKISMTSNEINLPIDETNLCIRAANLLQQQSGIAKGVKISLIKHIPIGAGLGGGSSDAASTLIGLVKLWELKISEEKLCSIALELGSDVPYFLKTGTAFATGRGEILEYFSLPLPYRIVILYPDVHVSTAWAYQSLESSNTNHIPHPTSHITLKDFLIKNIHNPHELNQNLLNDFEPVVLHQHKQIGFAKLMLYSEGACFAQMSGSGSSVFGFFKDEHKAVSAAEKLQNRYKVFITPPNFHPE
ncbi:MAG: 4-(cytidine 5'-diphospho)-2-C-methyl-D-erythritol kinase [Chlorobiaceae bacterium]|nr:4-(cytidine 5'-diphospho)-2-C-methyl-D-erythritol kinase [Chlorobiaceae bacterium]